MKTIALFYSTGNVRYAFIEKTAVLVETKYDTNQGIILTSPQGPLDLEGLISMINNAVEEGNSYECQKIMFDLREAKFALSFIEEYELNKNLLRLTNLTLKHRCAVIVTYDNSDNGSARYGEQLTKSRSDFAKTVGANWGTMVYEFFTDYEDGLSWLKST